MCMEDIRLGRKITGQQVSVNLLVTSIPAIDASPNRVSLVIYPPISGTLTLSSDKAAVVGSGLVMTSTSAPLMLDIKHHGNLVCKRWFAIHSAGGIKLNYTEGVLEDQ